MNVAARIEIVFYPSQRPGFVIVRVAEYDYRGALLHVREQERSNDKGNEVAAAKTLRYLFKAW